MASEYKVRWRWLKGMYLYTAVFAGGMGLAIVLVPGRVQSTFRMGPQDPLTFGLNGGLFLSFGLAAVMGLRAPLKYCPVLLMELAYKLVWLIGVVVPAAIRGEFPGPAIVQAVIFVTFVIGDLIATPFRYVFSRDPEPLGISEHRTP